MIALLKQCTTGPWITAGLDVQYKIEGETLCFQYTVSDSDWAHNFFAIPTESNCGERVHAGFNNLLESVLPEIGPKAGDIRLVTGFSQGGALAQLFSLFFDTRCIAFAAPKLVFMPRRTYPLIHRFEKRGDIVPWVPPYFCGVGSVQKIGRLSIPSLDNHYIESYEADLKG